MAVNMKNLKKLTAILIYIFIMSALLEFEFFQLFDLKQIILVLIGMFILFLPGYKHGESMSDYAGQLAGCAIFASYIQTFILLFTVLSTQITLEQLPKEAALSCRPLLYGICLWMILSGETQKKQNPSQTDINQTESKQTGIDNTQHTEPTQEYARVTASEAYETCRELGLTNREAELALLICKGLSNAEIAAELSISETTVKKHVSNIFEKLQISKREEILKEILKFI